MHFNPSLLLLMLGLCTSTALCAGSRGSSCLDLKAAQEKLASQEPKSWPTSCAITQKLYREYKTESPEFLKKCETNEKVSKEAMSSGIKKGEMTSLQRFLDPPSFNSFLGIEDSLGEECADGGKKIMQYRKAAQDTVGAINKRAREH